VRQRVSFLEKVGLEYLTLDRLSSSLSGGESQRIQLAASLGSRLVGALYVLDEPSIGLHTRDTAKLIAIMEDLRDLGNTILVVEHDPDVIRAADHLLDHGPVPEWESAECCAAASAGAWPGEAGAAGGADP
jgi:excinuclease ABC subunit A